MKIPVQVHRKESIKVEADPHVSSSCAFDRDIGVKYCSAVKIQANLQAINIIIVVNVRWKGVITMLHHTMSTRSEAKQHYTQCRTESFIIDMSSWRRNVRAYMVKLEVALSPPAILQTMHPQ